MDLHVVDALASPAERAAIDAVLDPEIGAVRGGWDGGLRDMALDGRAAHGGHEARSRRDLLLPALHALNDRIGWISRPGLGYICRRLTVPPAEAYGVATFYALLSTVKRPPAVAHVCDDMACRMAGAEDVCRDLERELGPAGEPAPGAGATWLRSPCLGLCERAPAALYTIAGDPPLRVAVGPVDAAEIVRQLNDDRAGDTGTSVQDGSVDTAPSDDRLASLRRSIPQAGSPGLRLLARVGRIDPTSLADFLATDGYRALRKAIDLGPRRVVEEVVVAEVLGRGGAGFPAGRKWAAAAASTGLPKYIVCNADEAEPGTFKDRAILEEDPFSLVEAMTIAGFATGAEKGYLYIRGEYPLGEARMANAIGLARDAGYLGADVMGTGFAFDIEIRRGGGAYIAGEGTALFESIEGKRAEPRNKAARSTTAGLFQRPTAVNNVETLVNIPGIILSGGAEYATIGTAKSTGHKLFSVSGHVERPGVYETEFGITIHDLIELAGGVSGGRTIKAVNLGGAAGVFVGPEAIHMPLTFEHAKEAGATLGAGAVVVFDETTDLLDILRRIAQFFRDESCGQCVPCRVGTVRQEELLARLMAGQPRGSMEDELELLNDLGRVLRDASICGLGMTANDALASGLRLQGVLA
ncbi:MAG: NAD(P)H-dependent oxidoreductase subunit E [Candidatus Limnocylindrales bacterium]